MSLPRTPSQTVGPFHAIAMRWADGPYAVPEGHPDAVWVRGRVLDGAGEPVDDAVVETWQPELGDGHGHGFARCLTDTDGTWGILTVKLGPTAPTDGTRQAPHLSVAVFARGLLKPVWTRIYFGDEPDANAVDPVLSVVEADRRSTLVAAPAGGEYRLDIRLQGEGETVFFDV